MLSHRHIHSHVYIHIHACKYTYTYTYKHIHTDIHIYIYIYRKVVRGVPVREDTYPEPSACEVRWPVPFLAAIISPVFPMGTHLLQGEQ